MNKQIIKLIKLEEKKNKKTVNLIASENYVSKDVEFALGSILTNKYCEGYPEKRYYSGCQNHDEIEKIAIKNVKKIFNAKFANVQPHSGTQANQAAYLALLKPGDKILGMSLSSGGHLTHGHTVSSSGIYYKSVFYEVDETTLKLNYEKIKEIAIKEKPKLIICGASSYSQKINFKKFKEIADEVGAFLVADVAHISGLIVAGLHENPLDSGADVLTSTTHKTLRGPRGGIILTNNSEIAQKIDSAVFPGVQGGPAMNVIAAKAIAFEEADTEEFKIYQEKILKNAKYFSKLFKDKGYEVLETQNHLFLVDVKKSFGLTGLVAQNFLEESGILVNKNSIPFEKERPNITSGIRIGTPAITTLGWDEEKIEKLFKIIVDVLENKNISNSKLNYKKLLKIL